MKRYLFAAVLSLAVPLTFVAAGCTAASVGQQITLDEKVGIAITNAYTAASLTGFSLASAGKINSSDFKELDDRAYIAVRAVRAAYLAGDARGYAEALAQADAAVVLMRQFIKGERNDRR